MCSVKKEMSPRSVIIVLLLSLFATFTFAKPGYHLIETEDGEGGAELDNDEKESVDPDDGEKKVEVHHVVEEDGEIVGERTDQLDPDDPKLKHHKGGKITYEDSDESVDPDNGEKVVKVTHLVEVDGEFRGESFSHLDPDDPKVKRYMGKHYMGGNNENDPSDEDISNPDDRDGKDGNSQVPQPIPGPTQPTPGPTQPTPKPVEESDKDGNDYGMNMAQWPGTGGRGKINWGTGTGTGGWQGSWF